MGLLGLSAWLDACSSDTAASAGATTTAGSGGSNTTQTAGGTGQGGDGPVGGQGGEGGACQPATCGAKSCGEPPDNCGGKLACGDCKALGETCGGSAVDFECGAAHPILHTKEGCFLNKLGANDKYEIDVGAMGTAYSWISIELEAVHGGWRTDLYDRPVLNHNLFGLSRNVSAFEGRYILGEAAQIKPDKANLDRRSVLYGRLDLDKKPAGQGWTGYTSFRDPYPWTEGKTYSVKVTLDAVGKKQTLVLATKGEQDLVTVGDIPYFDTSLTTSTFKLAVGGEESDGREVKPLGWTFCNLLVQAEPL